MAIINNLQNTANVTYNGNTISSNVVNTILLLPPTILKAVDKTIANIGDVLTYTVTIANISLSAYTNIPFTDVLPAGSTYVNNSFKLNNVAATPTVASNTLNYTIPTIPALGQAVLLFQVDVVGGSV